MRIQEVSKQTGLSGYTIRYYEKAGLIGDVPRDSAGHRFFREQDVKWIHFVNCLKTTGMPLKEIKAYAAKVGDAQNQGDFLLSIMQKHKKRLEQQLLQTQDFLAHIDWKITHYQSLIDETK
ncbi:MerR family transcriptional regulator [Motilimonas eburnea]|uniref:MerR family transcriptional regulator n=1 Tax=Motilimonas eburnea TaxID=1737488 RepID=UPI001E2DDD4C|nr:MerR family transcriptional regulator [Motilimonas eburnea]MCE2570048.1 MerR family transcriptional regulator [Motilimonas eburnea]